MPTRNTIRGAARVFAAEAFAKLVFGPRSRALEMAGKRRTSAGAAMTAPFDDELVASEEVLIAKWNELSDERLKEQVGKYRDAIKDLEKAGSDKGPTTFEFEEDVEVDGDEGGDNVAGVAGDADGGAAAPGDRGAEDAEAANDGLIEGNVRRHRPPSGWCRLSASPCTPTS